MKHLLLSAILFLSVTAFAQTYPKYTNEAGSKKTTSKPAAKLKSDGTEMKSETVKPSRTTGDFQELMNRAVEQSKEHNYAAAISLYTQALNVATEEQAWRALISRATTYIFMDKPNPDKALNDFNTIINTQKTPQKQLSYIYTHRARLLADKGDIEAACADIQKARELGLPENLIVGFDECK